jgi:hypothetical protein
MPRRRPRSPARIHRKMAILQNQLVQVTLPVMFTVLIAGCMAKGLDGIKGRLDDIVARLARMEGKP